MFTGKYFVFAAFRKRDIMFTLSGRRYVILKDIIVTAETADYSIGWESEKVSYLQFHMILDKR